MKSIFCLSSKGKELKSNDLSISLHTDRLEQIVFMLMKFDVKYQSSKSTSLSGSSRSSDLILRVPAYIS